LVATGKGERRLRVDDLQEETEGRRGRFTRKKIKFAPGLASERGVKAHVEKKTNSKGGGEKPILLYPGAGCLSTGVQSAKSSVSKKKKGGRIFEDAINRGDFFPCKGKDGMRARSSTENGGKPPSRSRE